MQRRVPALGLTFIFAGCMNGNATIIVNAGQSTNAVQQTVQSAPECTALGDFYWEFGNASGAQGSGSVGSTYSSGTGITIASASKMVFAAYILEKRAGLLTGTDQQAMNFTYGYANFSDCQTPVTGTMTINDCFIYAGNNTQTPAYVTKFYYNGGHFQKEAEDLGLAAMNNTALTVELRTYLGAELQFTFVSPQTAGGLYATAATYAAFLRKIMNGGLRMKNFLGVNAVCTLPASCGSAVFSPSPEAWHYSDGHWVEDDPSTGDGAFSSPGKFGFYPWISADKTTYGILAREDHSTNAWLNSVLCGRKLRKAWFSGQPQ